MSIVLFRVVREVLHNAIKYARAERIALAEAHVQPFEDGGALAGAGGGHLPEGEQGVAGGDKVFVAGEVNEERDLAKDAEVGVAEG